MIWEGHLVEGPNVGSVHRWMMSLAIMGVGRDAGVGGSSPTALKAAASTTKM
jgi:hypothetical protein